MLRYAKVREVKNPSRANLTDAGIDLFVPTSLTCEELLSAPGNQDNFFDYFEDVVLNRTVITIYPHCRINIPSGLHFDIEDGYALVAANKSGIATKKGLVFGAQVCDSGYQGEIHISVINTTAQPVNIVLGDKLLQLLYIPVRNDMPVEVEFDALYDTKSSRGADGFGSTDKEKSQ